LLVPPMVTQSARPGDATLVVTEGCKPVSAGLTAAAAGSGPVDAKAIVSAAGGKARVPSGAADAYEREFTADGRLQYCLSITGIVHVRADALLHEIAPKATIHLIHDYTRHCSPASGDNGECDDPPHNAGTYVLKQGSTTAVAQVAVNGGMQDAVVVVAPDHPWQVVNKVMSAEAHVDWGE